MQLYLDSFGAFLGVKNQMFWVNTKKNEEQIFATNNINAILLTKGVSLSVDAVLLAFKNDIPIIFIDAIGHPIGQIWSGYYGSIATIRKNQAAFVRSAEGWKWMRNILVQKIKNQRVMLQKINETQQGNTGFKRKFRSTSVGLNEMILKFKKWNFDETQAKTADFFRAWEAAAARHYWSCLSASLTADWQFKTRTYRPAENEFNALLNYLYGILYV
jgi:CRISP-associated protein Cas1